MKSTKFKGQAMGGFNPQQILIGLAITVLLVVVVLAFAAVFLAMFSGQLTTIGTTTGVNVDAAQSTVSQGQVALNSIPPWLPIIVIAFILLVILGVLGLIAYFALRMQGGVQ